MMMMMLWLLHCRKRQLVQAGTASSSSSSSHILGIQHGARQGRGFPSIHSTPHTDATPR